MNQPKPARWEDLRVRLLTGALLIVIGALEIWLGGVWFASMVGVITAIIAWEVARMTNPGRKRRPLLAGLIAGVAVMTAPIVDPAIAALILLAAAGLCALVLNEMRLLVAVFTLAVVVAGYGLAVFRELHGITWFVWLILVVVGTDIAGYFGGRMIGGPKFWPKVSPKKTWAGILCGWAVAALVGVVFLSITDAGRDLIWISVVLSFASQMGDIAESALKRRCGVKDSSRLLPGHGGLFDRFDALLGAALFMLLVALFVDVPVLQF